MVERFSAGGKGSTARRRDGERWPAPNKSPGQIAQETQGSAFPDRYEGVRRQADAILAAYGGAAG